MEPKLITSIIENRPALGSLYSEVLGSSQSVCVASVVRTGFFFVCFQLEIILVHNAEVVNFNGAKNVTWKCFFFAHQRENGGF